MLVSSPMTQRSVVLTGLAGVVGALFLTGLCLAIMVSDLIPVILMRPMFVWGLFLFLLFFSVVEIPVMIAGLRRIAESENPRARYIALFTNAGYTFFAGVYAVPFILLAGGSTLTLAAGTLLGLLTFARFTTSVIFLPNNANQ